MDNNTVDRAAVLQDVLNTLDSAGIPLLAVLGGLQLRNKKARGLSEAFPSPEDVRLPLN